MAVRRISDLPDLNAYYPNADLNDAKIEVSYAYAQPDEPRRYQSFSMNAYAMISSIASDVVNDLPIASNAKLGVVSIGDNIDVTSAGKISVKDATTTEKGILKAPPSGAAYIGTNTDGSWKAVAAPSSGGGGGFDRYDVIDITYPVGSVFIAAQPSIYPPGVTTAPTSEDQWTGISKTGMPTMKWKKITSASFWATSNDSEVGQSLTAVLPSPANSLTITCSNAGAHYHKMIRQTTSVEGSGHHANEIVMASIAATDSSSSEYKYMQTTGAHSHTMTLAQSTSESSVYNGSDNTVRPTSIGVAAWMRTA